MSTVKLDALIDELTELRDSAPGLGIAPVVVELPTDHETESGVYRRARVETDPAGRIVVLRGGSS